MSLATVNPPKATPSGPSALPTVPRLRASAPPSDSDGRKRESVPQFLGLSASPNSASRPVFQAWEKFLKSPSSLSQPERLDRKLRTLRLVPRRPTAVPTPLSGVHKDFRKS